jgi:hypothetical protein
LRGAAVGSAPAHEQQHHSNRVSGTGGLRFRETVF